MKTILSLITLCVLNSQLWAQVSFTNSSSPGVGSEATCVIAADVNEDGKMDLIAANYGNGYGNTLSALTNNGNGGFVLASSPVVGSGPRWITTADVNGDGKMDLISANYGANGNNHTLSVLTNNGNGGFTLASSPVLSSAPPSVAVLDLNGDGKMDLISPNADNTVKVLTNNGSGGFVQASSSDLGGNPESIVLFTNVDGRIGLITANYYNNTLSFMTNNGSSGFGLAALLAGGHGPLEATVADVNGDGKMDVISANYDNATLMVWTNNGNGGFGLASSPAVGNQPTTVVAADVNGDGKVDLISANYGNSTLTVLTNNGNGDFVLATTLTVGGNNSQIVAAADVNGDGKVDLIGAGSGNNTLSVWLNTTPSRPPCATGTAIVSFGFVVSVSVNNGGYGYTNTPLVRFVGGGGSGAGAVAVVSNGVVTGITITNNGSGYTNPPLVIIDPPFILNPVLGIAPMSLLSFSNLTLGGTYQLQQSVLWYWTNQPISFTATNNIYTQMVAGVVGNGNYRLALNPVPTQAFATPVVAYGFVVHATITSGGSGYVTSPAVSIVGGGGTNATVVSQIYDGVVTNISITNPGSDYTDTPTIQIAQPPVVASSSTVLPVMRVDASSLAPYDNYQIQFKPDLSSTWDDVNGGLFSPTDVTNSQYIFITNDIGFFRLRYVP